MATPFQCPRCQGCITEGDTREEALENAKDAIRLYLEDVEAEGLPPPEEPVKPELSVVEV